MPALVWIKIEDVNSTPWPMELVQSRIEATALSSSDAQQAIRWATDTHPKYIWEPVPALQRDFFIVQGSPK